jgi:hypothetical protein
MMWLMTGKTRRAVSTPASRLATELNDAPTGLNSRQF